VLNCNRGIRADSHPSGRDLSVPEKIELITHRGVGDGDPITMFSLRERLNRDFRHSIK
jgi:hypothetical protein